MMRGSLLLVSVLFLLFGAGGVCESQHFPFPPKLKTTTNVGIEKVGTTYRAKVKVTLENTGNQVYSSVIVTALCESKNLECKLCTKKQQWVRTNDGKMFVDFHPGERRDFEFVYAVLEADLPQDKVSPPQCSFFTSSAIKREP